MRLIRFLKKNWIFASVLIVLVALSIGLTGIIIHGTLNSPYIGAKIESKKGLWEVTHINKNGPAEKSGLKLGDKILKIGNLNYSPQVFTYHFDIASPKELKNWVKNRNFLYYHFIKNKKIELNLSLGNSIFIIPIQYPIALASSKLFSTLLLFGFVLSAIIVFLFQGYSTSGKAYSIFSVLLYLYLAPFIQDSLELPGPPIFNRLNAYLAYYLFLILTPFFLHFVLKVDSENRFFISKKPILSLYGLFGGILGFYALGFGTMQLWVWFTFGLFLSASGFLIWRFFKTTNLVSKKKLKWIAWGIIVSIGPTFIATIEIAILGHSLLGENNLIYNMMLLTIPISSTIALTGYKLWAIDNVLYKSIQVLIAFTMLWSITLMLGPFSSSIYSFISQPLVLIPYLLIFSYILNKISNKFEKKFLSRWFFKGHYEFEKSLLEIFQSGNKYLLSIQKSMQALSHNSIVQEIYVAYQKKDELVFSTNKGTTKFLMNTQFSDFLSSTNLQFFHNSPLAINLAPKSKIKINDQAKFYDYCFPLWSSEKIIGGLFILAKKGASPLSSGHLELLRKIASDLSHKIVMNLMTEKLNQDTKKRIMEIISTVSHDLKSPLLSMIWSTQNLEFMIDSGASKEKMKESLKTMNFSSEIMENLVQEIIDFTKIESGKEFKYDPKVCHIPAIIKQSLDQFELIAGTKKLRLISTFSHDTIQAMGEKKYYFRIIGNLIDNAIKYSKEDSEIKVSAIKEAEFVRIEVEDKGKGIREKEQGLIFDQFFQEEKNEIVNSVGLGLFIVKKLIVLQKGTIEVLSKVGKGTTFVLRFPLVKEAPLLEKLEKV